MKNSNDFFVWSSALNPASLACPVTNRIYRQHQLNEGREILRDLRGVHVNNHMAVWEELKTRARDEAGTGNYAELIECAISESAHYWYGMRNQSTGGYNEPN
jgi:hypothetical protein